MQFMFKATIKIAYKTNTVSLNSVETQQSRMYKYIYPLRSVSFNECMYVSCSDLLYLFKCQTFFSCQRGCAVRKFKYHTWLCICECIYVLYVHILNYYNSNFKQSINLLFFFLNIATTLFPLSFQTSLHLNNFENMLKFLNTNKILLNLIR